MYVVRSIGIVGKRSLMFDVWLPCNKSNNFCFWSFYICQSFGGISVAFDNVANECFIFAIIHNISLQLQLLTARFCKITSKNSILNGIDFQNQIAKDCIEDHNSILRYEIIK